MTGTKLYKRVTRRAGETAPPAVDRTPARFGAARVGELPQQARPDVATRLETVRREVAGRSALRAPRARHSAGRGDDKYVPPIEVHTVRPAFRAGREEAGRSSRCCHPRRSASMPTSARQMRAEPMVVPRRLLADPQPWPSNDVEYIVAQEHQELLTASSDRWTTCWDRTRAAPSSASLYADDDRDPRISISTCLHRHLSAPMSQGFGEYPHVPAQRAGRLLPRHLHGWRRDEPPADRLRLVPQQRRLDATGSRRSSPRSHNDARRQRRSTSSSARTSTTTT